MARSPKYGGGVYINLITLQTATSGLALPSWDLSPYHFQGAQFFGNGTTGVVAQAANGPASTFNTGIASGNQLLSGGDRRARLSLPQRRDGQITYRWVRVPAQNKPGTLLEFFYENAGNSIAITFPAPGATLPLAALFIAPRRRPSRVPSR